MGSLLLILQLAIEAAFVLVSVAAVIDWRRHRDNRRGHLAVAFASLAALVLIAPTLGQAGPFKQVDTDIALVIFLLSGYALVMVRDTFIPIRRGTLRAIRIAMVAVAVLAIAAQLPADSQNRQGPLQTIVPVAILVAWGACILEPTVRLWLAAMHRPAVESARLRALSLGYAALLAEVGVAALAGSAASHPYFRLAIDLVTLAIVPLLYVSFSPPDWLRWLWRQPEEDAFRGALHDLLLYSPDRATLANRALGWATRLVGGAGAVIVDSDGSILAARDLDEEEAHKVAEGTKAIGAVAGTDQPASRLVVPLHLQQGEGHLIVLSGPFTPLFGEDETLRLRQYAGSLAAGLDRVSMNQRIASLEKAKTEFLSVASHELRGPMTVIKGYLTMLEAGSLGEVSEQSKSILPLLIAKSDEVNWMVEQMVEAARLEDGRLALKKLPADLMALTDLAIEGVAELLSKHQLSVDKPKRMIEADVDPDRFQIVVKNLLSNAAKYSPPGAHITVRVSGDGMAKVAVTDEGVGIALEDQARLFRRFVRIQTKSTERVSGTGLGLWLSREIARMHDGDLTVESTPGRGSTFTLELPQSR